MNVRVETIQGGKCLVMHISGKFQFTIHREFRDAYTGFISPGAEIRVNLAGTNYLDSSALGMLMLLHAHAQTHKQTVSIESPQPVARRILEIASFDKIFPIL